MQINASIRQRASSLGRSIAGVSTADLLLCKKLAFAVNS
jgi:hypothetical protein